MICNNPQVFKLFNFFQFRVFQEKTRSEWLNVLSDYFGHLVTSTFLVCKCRGLPGSTPVSFPVMRRWKCLIKRSSQPGSITPGKRAEKTCRRGSRREASNAKSGKSVFHFKPEKVNKFEYCNNLWKQNIFHNPIRKLKACFYACSAC